MIYRFLAILLLFFFNWTSADDLEGRVIYNEETARIEAFKDLSRKIPKALFKDDLKDKNYKENYKNIKKKNYQIETEPSRILTPFYVMNQLAAYAVQYDNDINKKYYYNALGHLVKFEINDYAKEYPYRAIAYNRKGEVISIVLIVSEAESFVFNKDEELLGHWFDEHFYNIKGKEKFKRELGK